MTQSTRYILYTLAYVFIIAGLLSQSYLWLAITFLASLIVGLWAGANDDRRDEPFKHVNQNFHYHH